MYAGNSHESVNGNTATPGSGNSAPQSAGASDRKPAISPDFGEGGGAQMDDPIGTGIDPEEMEPWVIRPFTDPRTGATYDIIEGRVIICFKNPPATPNVDPNYFDVERNNLDPVYSVPYPPVISDPAIAAFIASENLTVLSEWLCIRALSAKLPPGQTVEDAVANWPLEYPGIIEAVDPDAIALTPSFPEDDPNDGLFQNQWAINEDSTYDINVQAAWQAGYFGSGIGGAPVLAFMDTGVQYNYIDLDGNTTPKGANTWDRKLSTQFLARSAGGGSPATWLLDQNAECAKNLGHGTCNAGIACAVINNDGNSQEDERDIAGIALYSKFFPIAMKAFYAQNGSGGYSSCAINNAYTAVGCVKKVYIPSQEYPSSIAQTVPWHNIEVVCVEYSREGSCFEWEKRHLKNLSKFMLFVCAAGNHGSSTRSDAPSNYIPDPPPLDPDGYMKNPICVAAYDSYGQRGIWEDFGSSNYAPDTDICAPGSSIWAVDMKGTNYWGNSLGYSTGIHTGFVGTSAAAPHVAAVALLIGSDPMLPYPYQVRQRILDNKAPLPLGSQLRPFGRLDAYAALEAE